MGNGDVLEAPPADGVMGIGSGADFAESAARALLQLQRDVREGRVAPGGAASGGGGAAEEAQAAGRGQLAAVADMSLLDIARTAMRIAADSCVYTNTHFSWHHILPDGSIESGGSAASS
jgi:ATP-dependent protease HslVU (ClpYQ) peptidase subunit